MMPPKLAKICALLREMPLRDRQAALLIAMIEYSDTALDVSLCMLNATVKLSRGQSADSRFKISEALRDAADQLEHPCVARAEIK
jgi:hypothetical protein